MPRARVARPGAASSALAPSAARSAQNGRMNRIRRVAYGSASTVAAIGEQKNPATRNRAIWDPRASIVYAPAGSRIAGGNRYTPLRLVASSADEPPEKNRNDGLKQSKYARTRLVNPIQFTAFHTRSSRPIGCASLKYVWTSPCM